MSKSKKKYYLFHLLNNYSGSPLVLRQIAQFLSLEHEVHVITSKGSGFLTDIPNVALHNVNYKWKKSKLLTLWNFLMAQINIFFKVIRLEKGSVIYVNTLLPFAAAIAGKIKDFQVIYHLHEPQVSPPTLFNFLKKVAKKTSDRQIYVSHYLKQELNEIVIKKSKVIYNCISADFFEKSERVKDKKKKEFEVLMACSLKKYKGVYEFVELAKELPEIQFKLILSDKGKRFTKFQEKYESSNCKILPAQSSMLEHYAEASLVLSLSNQHTWVESFGLTIVEAMSFGIPVIGPVVGGPVEIIRDGVNGYLIDSKETEKLKKAIIKLKLDTELYDKMSLAARGKAHDFTCVRFKKQLLNFLEEN